MLGLLLAATTRGAHVASPANGGSTVFTGIIYVFIWGLIYFAPTIIALKRKPVQEGPAIIVDVLLGWTIIGWIVAFALACGASRQEISAAQETAREQQDAINAEYAAFARRTLEPVPAPQLVLANGERCYWVEDATAITIAIENQRVGGYGGASFRVARGLYVRSGSTRAHTIQVPHEVRFSGRLYLTNRRLVFITAMATTQCRYDSLLSFTAFADGFRVDPPNSKPIIFMSNSLLLGIAFQRIVSGFFAGIPDEAPSGEQPALTADT